MKPQNKFQQAVLEASKSLPPVTKVQIKWGYENAIEHIGHRTEKGVITCTHCGHSWQGAGYLVSILSDCHCPNCKTKLKVETTKKRKFDSRYYMTIITAHKGYQVLRTVLLFCTAKTHTRTEKDRHQKATFQSQAFQCVQSTSERQQNGNSIESRPNKPLPILTHRHKPKIKQLLGIHPYLYSQQLSDKRRKPVV